jgi:molecular chaperone DnaK (HSP70)
MEPQRRRWSVEMSDIEGPEFAGSEAELRYENNKPVTPEDVDVETVRERLWRSRGSYDGKPVHNLKGTLPAEFAALSRLETRLRTAEARVAELESELGRS